MNYQTVKTHLEAAHRILIHSAQELDLHNLGDYSACLKRKDWRGALGALEECGSSTECDAAFWREMLGAARELELPRYVARFEARVKLEA
ncbi:MAG TPA: hypothetical protein VF627_03925 [Abditibacterium sp.]|jgi:hypothetical protein